MSNILEMQALAKELAPVFSKLLQKMKHDIESCFEKRLDERDQRISQLEKALSDQKSVTVAEEKAVQQEKSVKAEDVLPELKLYVDDYLKQLPPAKDGQSVTVDELKPVIEALLAEAVKALPTPKDGEPGKDADMEALQQTIKELVAELPTAKDGLSVTLEDVLPELKQQVEDYLKQIPTPKDGEPGKDAVAPSVDEIAATFERRFSDLSLSWERQAREVFEKAADKMPVPKNGENGRDALPLETFDLTLGEDLRTVTVKMMAGETLIEKSVRIPALIDQGVFTTEKTYEAGDGVSYGGCYWIAKCDKPQGVPGSGETDWRRAVNRGRDGKDLRSNASTIDTTKGISIRKDQSQ